MRIHPLRLLNTAEIELWPACLLRARGNHDARAIARARWVLRRKADGRYLAADLPEGLLPLVTRLSREPGIDEALDRLLAVSRAGRGQPPNPAPLPMCGLPERLQAIGVDQDYGARVGLGLTAEPDWLSLAGFDCYRRPLWLLAPAARAWQRMRSAAAADAVTLEAISGYRSHAYQLAIFQRKFARGQTLEQILAVNAAPGYSEHHGGCALDIGQADTPPADELFETTPGFAWLQARAGEFGFRMSYPRNNPHGIVYEPWHWRWQAP